MRHPLNSGCRRMTVLAVVTAIVLVLLVALWGIGLA